MRIGNFINTLQGLAIAGLLIQGACGGGGTKGSGSTSTPPAATVNVSLTGAPADAICGDPLSVTAQVSGTTNPAVTWLVDGIQNGNPDVGTISGSGNTVTYTAPGTEGTHLLAATSVTDTTKTATAPIRIHHQTLQTPTINAPATALAGATGLSACATNPQSFATYAWSISGGTIQGPTTGTSVSFSAGQAGTLALTCRATSGTQTLSSTAHVQVQGTLPAVPLITAPTSATVGATNLVASVTQPEGSTSYSWTIVDGTITAGASSTSVTFTAGSAGTLTLTCMATNSVGNSSSQAQVQVVASAPATPVITAPSQVNAQSTSNLASIPAQSNCTYAWTITGGTISAGQGTTNLAFTAGGAGTLLLGCTVTNSSSISASAQKSIAVLTVPAQTAGFYGSGLNADDLGNQVIGWNSSVDTVNRKASIRVRATHSGTLTSIRPKFIWSTVKGGYGAGTGGNIVIQIQTDDGSSNHLPSGTVLASLQYNQPITIGNYFPLLTFSNPANLTAGQLYHVVFTNVDADPTVNYISLDHLFMWNACTSTQPLVSNTDLGLLETNTAGAWVAFVRGSTHSYSPTIQLTYGDGASQGQGYIQGFGQTSTSGWVNPKPISGTQSVRETFTVSGVDRTVTAINVRANRISGSSPLTVTIEKSDGTLVGQGTVLVPLGGAGSTSANEAWVSVKFGTPLTLQAGVGYHLVLSSPADTVHTTHALEKGNVYGFPATTYFADGYAQFNSGTGWLGWDLFAVANRTDCDLQFYFVTQ
ncbi:MAG: hypothetical protein HXX12_16400 [Geothrix sp.]|uniref:PKD domain-containing protein n=1 Tax=Geothrix sp. TaxID=1962974 RepID=UPI0018525BD2|nr:hypothetical protein [Geothrix sp.]NWJ42544.1 hypothetical protein [Geothrix sp.]WIL19495.1 MAG: hypothetical protein QOZ81_002014 [Geothrix sp.]